MSILNFAFVGAVAVVCLGWWVRQIEKLEWVRTDSLYIYEGNPKKDKKIAFTAIKEISIAPLFDVAPFDNFWLLEGKDGERIGFLGRSNGAAAALVRLESYLSEFNVATSIAHAHEHSMFEEAVVVWRDDAITVSGQE
ncbi:MULTISPECIES: hypothetical protein [unclassified Achromobacter]|uniref:hypothetical protein n=1 Tax=unclassified Achromobacter TaxID=2626865 RepID=UPI000B51D66C|nr:MULTISPECIES: hypothetical protein [unclassified Achromobacter]OWT73780.1 hypothetical protein CEY05_22115 [Achromobacter sp. HZ34]OWT79304.1 hypothetical protein CEY04_09865 [Achromobacter sp. HZ28]